MSLKEKFDVIVIGAGPGGYVAAIKATQYGKSVALIEKGQLGGTCLNVGCIPTKTLIANAEVLEKVKKANEFGIKTGDISIDYAQMKKRKDSVVTGIRTSLEGLIKSNKIKIFKGTASFETPKSVKVVGEEKHLLSADKIIIATGSDTLDIKAFPCDHKKVLNSTSILEMTKLPKSLVVIGGGYIGCEFASLYSELGVKVTIVEALSSIVEAQGKEISKFLTDKFKSNGIEIITSTSVEMIDKTKDGVTVKLSSGKSVKADVALVSIGRRLNTDGLLPENAGISLNKRGGIEVNAKMETSVSGIYAIGDVTGKAMLAHVASHQGIIAAANACGEEAFMHYDAIPAVIFTIPEIATVGLSLEQAGDRAIEGKFPFMALGKSQATKATEGFAKVIIDKQTGQVLGAQAIGHEAATMIGEMAVAIANELTVECITETIHAHPTIAEGWLEAALIAQGSPIHFPPKVKRG